VTSIQESLIILLLVVVLVLLAGSGYIALLRERYRRGRDGDQPEPSRPTTIRRGPRRRTSDRTDRTDQRT